MEAMEACSQGRARGVFVGVIVGKPLRRDPRDDRRLLLPCGDGVPSTRGEGLGLRLVDPRLGSRTLFPGDFVCGVVGDATDKGGGFGFNL